MFDIKHELNKYISLIVITRGLEAVFIKDQWVEVTFNPYCERGESCPYPFFSISGYLGTIDYLERFLSRPQSIITKETSKQFVLIKNELLKKCEEIQLITRELSNEELEKLYNINQKYESGLNMNKPCYTIEITPLTMLEYLSL